MGLGASFLDGLSRGQGLLKFHAQTRSRCHPNNVHGLRGPTARIVPGDVAHEKLHLRAELKKLSQALHKQNKPGLAIVLVEQTTFQLVIRSESSPGVGQLWRFPTALSLGFKLSGWRGA